MFSILYVLILLETGETAWKPLLHVEPSRDCELIKEEILNYHDLILECIEYREV